MDKLYALMNVMFFGYILFITFKYGVQSSVSESYYRLPRNLQWLFTLVTWGYAIPAMIIGLDFTGNGLVFLAGAGIEFVGASPAFHKMGVERLVHTIGAFVGILAMNLFLVVVGYWYITAIFVVLSILFYLIDSEKIIWWVEILAFLSISIAYYLMFQ